jgi:hypothetical protein
VIVPMVAGPEAYSPATHPYLKAWWDPQHSGVGHGQPVVSVPDLSASGWTLTQTDASKRPTFSAQGINGQPGWLFTGTQFLRTLAIAGGKRMPSTVWAIVKGTDLVNASGSIFAFDQLNGSSTLGGATGRSSANKWTYITNASGTNITSAADSDNQPRVLTVSTTAEGVSTLYVNGVSQGTVTSTARDAFTQFVVGARGDGANGWRGLIGDPMVFSAAMTPGGTFTDQLNWYATKYGMVI